MPNEAVSSAVPSCVQAHFRSNSPREAVSAVLNMFDIFLATSRGRWLTKFARTREERAELTASRGILHSSFLKGAVCYGFYVCV